jgi:hypothetical protein
MTPLFAALHESGYGRFCCKTILSTPARKIDSRSRSKAQHRFKSACSRIRLFQIQFHRLQLATFATKSAHIDRSRRRSDTSGIGGKADLLRTSLKRR